MGAPQVRLSELGERLIDQGWEVEALTALPNYPTGKVFPGYDVHTPVVESVGRIRTVRVPLFTSKCGFVSRLRSYYSFVRSAKRYGPKLCQRPDLIFVESPPLFIGAAALYLGRRWKCPYVFNVSDLWPESAIRMGVVKPGIATWLAEKLELKYYRRAAGVTGQSIDIIASVRSRQSGVATEVITNGVDPDRFGAQFADAEARSLVGSEPGPVFVYAGLFGLAQGLDQVLDIAAAMPRELLGRFVLVGDGPERDRLCRRVNEESIDRVRILAVQPRNRIPTILACADVAIITLGMAIPGAVPSKIYEAMASSLPILLIASGEAARRVEDARCGIAVNPGDMDAAKKAVAQLAGDARLRATLGAAGRNAAETLYSRDSIAIKLDRFLRRAAGV